MKAPKPGIYPYIPFDEYLSWESISNSSLQLARRSMQHYKMQRPIEETPQMRLGTLCHSGKFEPLSIGKRYVVMPAFELAVRRSDGSEYDKPKNTAAYKELVHDFTTTNKDKIVVTQNEFDAMLQVCRALAEHPRASEYLSITSNTMVECAIVWEDGNTGLLCKGRVDAYQQEQRLCGDLKTSNDVEKFEKVVYQRSYHRQGAFYCDGLESLTGEPHEFAIVAVENSSPYGVRAAKLSVDAMEAGRDEYSRLLRQIAECRESNVWPGYSDPDEWRLPSWAIRSDEPLELIIGGKSVSM